MLLGCDSFSVQPTNATPTQESLFVCFRDKDVLLSVADGQPKLPTYAQIAPILPADFAPFELAHVGQAALFSPHPFLGSLPTECDGLTYQSIQAFRQMEEGQASIFASAWHLWNWYRDNRYCGRCGKSLTPDSAERALRCNACGKVLFPSIAPAVIVAITYENKILLARNAHQGSKRYALIAGYVEVGETLEHAVHREVMEEVGLTLQTLRYIGNQPWGVSGSQMFAFHAQAATDGPITLQQSEIADARWFTADELTPRDHTISIAYELIERFRTGRL